jgi:signal transduction histidine kinase
VTELPEEPELDEAAREALYRIATEALHNITKHARAQHVRISLAVDGGHADLHVEDDGVGFDADAQHAGHLGLQSMRERAEACGGTLVLRSAPGRGSALRVRIPSQR